MTKIKTNKIITIDCSELDRIVEEVYGRPYCYQQQEGCRPRGTWDVEVYLNEFEDCFKNDTIPEIVNGSEMGVSFKAWLARDPKQKIKNQKQAYQLRLWWERNFYPHLDMVLQDLCKKKVIKEGEYTIIIDW